MEWSTADGVVAPGVQGGSAAGVGGAAAEVGVGKGVIRSRHSDPGSFGGISFILARILTPPGTGFWLMW